MVFLQLMYKGWSKGSRANDWKRVSDENFIQTGVSILHDAGCSRVVFV